MNPEKIARRLVEFAGELEPIEVAVQRFPIERAEEEFLEHEFGLHQRVRSSAEELLRELQDSLDEANWNPGVTGGTQGDWTFGTAMMLRGPSREIHGGFLDPIRRIPLLRRVPEQVALYLITIDRGEDFLENETHSGVGWHYHYLDWRKRRSDVILCWDTRWTAPSPSSVPPSKRGLFVEKHADGGKPFKAKPWRWGDRKRETMYDVCCADLKKRKISEYRCAADKADPVYPAAAILTPRTPAAISTASTGKGRKKGRGKR